jgi:hypothetical protein
VPYETLRLQAGLRFLKRDVSRTLNEETAPGTQRTWKYTPVVRATWRPNPKLTVRGDLEAQTTIDPYTRLSPEGSIGSSIRLQYAFHNAWRVDNTWSFRNRETDQIGLSLRSRRNSTTLSYMPGSSLSYYGGFTYDSFLSENTVIYQRGQPPLTGLLSTDQTIDRTIFWGLQAEPRESLQFDFTGQFVRSTGRGVLTGEASTYGPLTWGAWGGDVSYNFAYVGQLSFGWQRSYYLEDLMRATDYSSNAFTLRINRSF